MGACISPRWKRGESGSHVVSSTTNAKRRVVCAWSDAEYEPEFPEKGAGMGYLLKLDTEFLAAAFRASRTHSEHYAFAHSKHSEKEKKKTERKRNVKE